MCMFFGTNLKPPGIAYRCVNYELQRHYTDTARCNLLSSGNSAKTIRCILSENSVQVLVNDPSRRSPPGDLAQLLANRLCSICVFFVLGGGGGGRGSGIFRFILGLGLLEPGGVLLSGACESFCTWVAWVCASCVQGFGVWV